MGKHRISGLPCDPRLDPRSLEPAADQAGRAFSADSYSPGYEPALAGDGDLATIWHTEFVGASPGYPHELVVDLGGLRDVEGMLYIPRQDSPNGRVRISRSVSPPTASLGQALATGRWDNDTTFKYVALSGRGPAMSSFAA